MVCERIIGMAWIENRYLPPSARQFKQFVFDFMTINRKSE